FGDHNEFTPDSSFFGVILQYPDVTGEVSDYSNLTSQCKEVGVKVGVGADLLSLVLLTPPGQWGADVVYGNSQRFGVPMGYGGPHAAFFATQEENKRHIPGRIIGVSVDADGNRALRMALQTREQHIRRDKATSNICTAQALLAVMAGMYAVYHGPNGLREIALDVYRKTAFLSKKLTELGFEAKNKNHFDTLTATLPEGVQLNTLKIVLEAAEINIRYVDDQTIAISLDETTTEDKLGKLIVSLADAIGKSIIIDINLENVTPLYARNDAFLQEAVFNSYHSETEMMRYLKMLENRDLSLTHSMIPLGSCTMKL